MAQGLQVFDASGNVMVKVTSSITLFLGTFTITKSSPKVIISNPLIATNKAFYCRDLSDQSNTYPNRSNDNVEVQNGSTYTVEFKNLENSANFKIYIGVY